MPELTRDAAEAELLALMRQRLMGRSSALEHLRRRADDAGTPIEERLRICNVLEALEETSAELGANLRQASRRAPKESVGLDGSEEPAEELTTVPEAVASLGDLHHQEAVEQAEAAPAPRARPRGPAGVHLAMIQVPRDLVQEVAALWPELAQASPEAGVLCSRRSAQGAVRLLLRLAIDRFGRLMGTEAETSQPAPRGKSKQRPATASAGT